MLDGDAASPTSAGALGRASLERQTRSKRFDARGRSASAATTLRFGSAAATRTHTHACRDEIALPAQEPIGDRGEVDVVREVALRGGADLGSHANATFLTRMRRSNS